MTNPTKNTSHNPERGPQTRGERRVVDLEGYYARLQRGIASLYPDLGPQRRDVKTEPGGFDYQPNTFTPRTLDPAEIESDRERILREIAAIHEEEAA